MTTTEHAADLAAVRAVIADVETHAVDGDGAPIGVGHAMSALHVLTREQGRWWIAARQNTLVPN